MGFFTALITGFAVYRQSRKVDSSRWKNIVYLSSGRDTRDGFTSHLHQNFQKAKIRIYMQDPDEEAINELLPRSLDEMKNSRFLVVVFSESFASSEGCLDELVQIMMHGRSGERVKPIFYKVNPSELRLCNGKTGEYLAAHERKYGKDSEKIVKWRNAIKELGGIKGSTFRSCRSNEADCIATFVGEIARETFNIMQVVKLSMTGRLTPRITFRHR